MVLGFPWIMKMAIPWAGAGIHWVGQKVHSGVLYHLTEKTKTVLLLTNPILWQHLCVSGKSWESVTIWQQTHKGNRKKYVDLVVTKKMKCQMMTHTFSFWLHCGSPSWEVYHMLSLIWITNQKSNLKKKFFFQICSLSWHCNLLRKKSTNYFYICINY